MIVYASSDACQPGFVAALLVFEDGLALEHPVPTRDVVAYTIVVSAYHNVSDAQGFAEHPVNAAFRR